MIRKSSNLGILSITAIMAALVVLSFAAPVSAEEMIGGDQGWYVVHCNVDGASVYFDDDYKGEISGGVLNVPVYTTGTPYKTCTVSKDGYTTFTEPVSSYPGKGETVDLYATLNQAPAPTTKAPLSMATAIFALAGAVLVMAVSRKQ